MTVESCQTQWRVAGGGQGVDLAASSDEEAEDIGPAQFGSHVDGPKGGGEVGVGARLEEQVNGGEVGAENGVVEEGATVMEGINGMVLEK